MILVILETPYASHTKAGVRANEKFARACMRDCIKRGEAPYASHLLYTQPGVLDDKDPEERKLGIEAGLLWGKHAAKTVVYLDRGVTDGMFKGMHRADAEGREIERRWLDPEEAIRKGNYRMTPIPIGAQVEWIDDRFTERECTYRANVVGHAPRPRATYEPPNVAPHVVVEDIRVRRREGKLWLRFAASIPIVRDSMRVVVVPAAERKW